MKFACRNPFLFAVFAMLALPLIASAKPAPKEKDDGPTDRGRKASDDRLDRIADQLERMQADMRRLNERMDQLQGRAAKPKEKAEKRPQPEERPYASGRRARPFGGRPMPPMPERRGFDRLSEHPMLGQILSDLREEVGSLRREAGDVSPRVFAERLRDALQKQVIRLDRFLEKHGPDDKAKADHKAGPKGRPGPADRGPGPRRGPGREE